MCTKGLASAHSVAQTKCFDFLSVDQVLVLAMAVSHPCGISLYALKQKMNRYIYPCSPEKDH